MSKMTLEDFKRMPKEHREYYISDFLPVINAVDNHIIGVQEVCILLEHYIPIIEEKSLFGDSLKIYLEKYK